MSPKRINRFAKNWQPPEKEWYQSTPTPEIQEQCRCEREEYEMSRRLALRIARKVCGQPTGKPDQNVLDVVDAIWAEGYLDAKTRYDPGHGAPFKTFLYTIFYRIALDERRRHFPLVQKVGGLRVTVCDVGNVNGIIDNRIDNTGQPRHRYCRYKFDFGGLILERYPCGFEPPSINVETLHGEFDEEIHPVSPVENRITCRELEDILHEVGKMSDEEFAEIKRQHLPALYRPLTDKALRKVLATLDVGIVRLLIGPERAQPATKKEIYETLGIKRDFYEARIRAILRRLDLSGERYQRLMASRRGEPKYCLQKLDRLIEKVAGPIPLKKIVYAPSSPAQTRAAEVNETVSYSPRRRSDAPLQAYRKDSEHWELVDEFMEEE